MAAREYELEPRLSGSSSNRPWKPPLDSGRSSRRTLAASVRSRRVLIHSLSRLRAVVTSQARGLAGVPSRAQRSAAIAKASCRRPPRRGRIRRGGQSGWRTPRAPTRRGRPARGSLALHDRAHLDGATHASRRDPRRESAIAASRSSASKNRYPPRASLTATNGPSVVSASPFSTRTVVAVSGSSICSPGVTPDVELTASHSWDLLWDPGSPRGVSRKEFPLGYGLDSPTATDRHGMKYRGHLPQLDGDPFLTDGGIETVLIFQEGIDLPMFAAFDLLKDEEGSRKSFTATTSRTSRWRANEGSASSSRARPGVRVRGGRASSATT